MSLFVCAKCGCVDNTATSSYWMLTNEYMVDKFEYAKELQPYKGMGLCSECGRLATSPDGRDVVVPGKWHGKFPKEKATEEQLKHVGYKNLTVRDGKYLQDAVDWFRYNHINLYSVNYNPEPVSSSPKVYCDYYIDDRNIGTPLTDKGYVDWDKMLVLLRQKNLL